MNKGEVWFVEFPLEEDESKSINRPVIVLDENILGVLSVKITKHKARKEDPYPMRRKTPCFSYGDIRRVHRIYASN